jgi:hypothetical protein
VHTVIGRACTAVGRARTTARARARGWGRCACLQGGAHGGGDGEHGSGKGTNGFLEGTKRTLLDIGFFIFFIFFNH